ncbi:MAG: hypothetical protein WC329_02920 [Candidatus Omnitrophota bacterium]|jgi:adenine/guanine phosphoribosyltransferase-like PRPP-binding protein
MALIPVDYDPFAAPAGIAEPPSNLVRVKTTPAAGNLIPVDYDPFATPAQAAPAKELIPPEPSPGVPSVVKAAAGAKEEVVGGNLIPVDYDPFAASAPVSPASTPEASRLPDYLQSKGIGGNIARTATSAGGMLAEKGAQIVQGLEDTAQGVTGLPRAIRDKAFTYLWQAFPETMQKFQESRQLKPTQPLEESKAAQIKAQGEQVANDFMDEVRETHAETLNEIHKHGGIPAYVAQQIGEGALSLAIDLALLHKVSGAQPAELTGSRELMRQAAIQNAKASAAIFASTPGTPEEKTQAALHSISIMGTPTMASQLPRNWLAKTTAILTNAGINTEAYMNGIQEAQRMAEQNGNPSDWPKYAVATLGTQAMTDFMFGILTRARRGDMAARELLNTPETMQIGNELKGKGINYDQESQRRMAGIERGRPQPGRAVSQPGAGGAAAGAGGVVQAQGKTEIAGGAGGSSAPRIEPAPLGAGKTPGVITPVKPLAEIKPSPVIFSTPNTLHLVQRKMLLNKTGQTPENAERLVENYYKPDEYAPALKGKDNVYLVTPSTSGKNLIADELAARLQSDFGGEIIKEFDYAKGNAREPAKKRSGYIRKMMDPSTFEVIDPNLAARTAGKNVIIVDDIFTSGETTDGLREALANQGIPVNNIAVLTALQAGKPVGQPTLRALANRMSKIINESPKQILNDLMLAHSHSSAKLIQNLERELRVQDGGQNARQIREFIRGKAETIRALLGGGAKAQPGESSGSVLAAGVRAGTESVQGIPAVAQSGPGPAESGKGPGISGQQTRPGTETSRGLSPAPSPQNKSELDKLYPGRIQLIDHPAGGITYLHKDMTPDMRADWFARPESHGPRATQAAGLDTFMREVAAREGGKMRGFAKRVAGMEELPPDQAAAVRANPENYYDPQSYRAINERLNRMTDDELAVARDTTPVADGPDNISVKAGLELFNRKLARGQDVQEDVARMSQKGTKIAQLLRQYAELKTRTPEGQLLMIEMELNRNKRQLSGAQRERLKGFIDEDFRARDLFHTAERMLEREFTDANAKHADEMERLANASNRRLVAMVRDMTPMSISKMLTQALQGNLLTPLSQIRNITGNLFLMPLRDTGKAIGAALDKVESLFSGGRRTVLSPTVGTFEAFKGAYQGVKIAGQQFTGGKTAEKISGETIQGFRPLRAAVQAWSGEGLALTREGKISKIDRFKKALEAVLGVEAEPMLRMLSFGDLPFSEAARMKGLAEQGRLRGFQGEELQKFIRFPDAKAREVVEKEMREAVFQQDNPLSDILNFAFKKMEGSPVATVAARTVVPYVKTPSNIMLEGMRYALPPIPLYEAVRAAVKGDRRAANLNIGQTVTGAMMTLAALYLAKHGIIMGDPDKDPKRRGLQYGAGAPNSLNLSALNRLKRGESSEWREGDRLINFQYLGFFGLNCTIAANSHEAVQRTLDKAGLSAAQRMGNLAGELLSIVPQTGAAVLNLSTLKGTSALLDAVQRGQYDSWLSAWFQTASSIPLPNTLAAINRARMSYLPELRGDGPLESFEGAVKAKLFMTENMPLKRDLFGRPIRTTPEGDNPWVWNFIDVTKTRQIPADPIMREVYQVYSATRDPGAIPSIPERRVMMPGPKTHPPQVPRELTVREYERYQELVGEARMNRMNIWLSNEQYNQLDPAQKVIILEKIWRTGAKEGKMRFVQELLGRPIPGTPAPFKARNAGPPRPTGSFPIPMGMTRPPAI